MAESVGPLYKPSPRQSIGFMRMRRRGAILPPDNVMRRVAEIVGREYAIELLRLQSIVAGFVSGVSDASGEHEKTYQWVIRAIKEQLARELKSEAPNESVISALSHELRAAQEEFFREFSRDMDERMASALQSMAEPDAAKRWAKAHPGENYASLSTLDVLEDKVELLHAGYLKSAIERIDEGKSDLRKTFIRRMEDWIKTGAKSDDLDEILAKTADEAGVFSRFFARDQMSRFNRALTIASYQTAGARWVKWIAVGDSRVRPKHRALNGKIFRIDDLPDEYIKAYNCRCSWIPIFELPAGAVVSKGDGIELAV